jgi:4-carboxymuconolactone decarboxylase
LVVLSVLIAQRQAMELKNHVRIALNNGLTPREIEEALIQTLPYVGFPAAASAMTSIIEVLRERGIATDTQTSEERGLL